MRRIPSEVKGYNCGIIPPLRMLQKYFLRFLRRSRSHQIFRFFRTSVTTLGTWTFFVGRVVLGLPYEGESYFLPYRESGESYEGWSSLEGTTRDNPDSNDSKFLRMGR
jgi:hypothetical protein